MPTGPYSIFTAGDLLALLTDPGVQNAIRGIVPAGWTIPSTSAPGDTSNEGHFGAWAQADHRHGRESAPAVAGLVKLQEFILSSSAASVSFSAIPATYRHLLIEWQARCDNAVGAQLVFLQLNGDAGANYASQFIDISGSTITGGSSALGTSPRIGIVVGANATAGYSGVGTIYIPNYAGTTFNKIVFGQSPSFTAAATAEAEQLSVLWQSTSAISSVMLTPQGGNFIAGSTFTLYATT